MAVATRERLAVTRPQVSQAEMGRIACAACPLARLGCAGKPTPEAACPPKPRVSGAEVSGGGFDVESSRIDELRKQLKDPLQNIVRADAIKQPPAQPKMPPKPEIIRHPQAKIGVVEAIAAFAVSLFTKSGSRQERKLSKKDFALTA